MIVVGHVVVYRFGKHGGVQKNSPRRSDPVITPTVIPSLLLSGGVRLPYIDFPIFPEIQTAAPSTSCPEIFRVHHNDAVLYSKIFFYVLNIEITGY